MKTVFCTMTDQGKQKKKNQDACYVNILETGEVFAILCDGVGSYVCSEIASRRAVDVFADWFVHCCGDLPAVEDQNEFCGLLYERWNNVFDSINDHILRFAQVNNIKLGCTLSCILLRQGYYYILHIGDTRIYSISEEIKQLTEDHTVSERNIRRNLVSREEAEKGRSKHTLTKCLGVRKGVSPDFYSGSLSPGTKFLLCSDGFRNFSDGDQLLKTFHHGKPLGSMALKRAVKKIIRSDRKKGEKDNITAIVIQVGR